MVAKRPSLLETDARPLRERLHALASALRQPAPRVARTALHQPALLGMSAAAAGKRLAAAAAALRVSPQRVSALALKQPLLLLLDSQQFASRLAAISEALNLGDPALVIPMVVSRPLLLGARPEALARKARALRAALGATNTTTRKVLRAAPQLLERSERLAGARVGDLRSLLRGQANLSLAIRREPRLLTRMVKPLESKVAEVQQLLGCSDLEAVAVVASRPSLLLRSVNSLCRSARALSIWRLDAAYKQQLLQEHPSLLRLSAAEVHGRCRWLRAQMLRSGHLHATLRRLPAGVLGVLVLHLPKAWRRLQYLVDSKQEGALQLMDAVRLTDRRFAQLFPEFPKWRGWSGKQPKVGKRTGAVMRLVERHLQGFEGLPAPVAV